jgi:uncharacterized protein
MKAPVIGLPTIAALFLALCGPPLLSIVSQRVLGDSTSVARMLPFDLILWAMLALVLAVVIYVERQPLASIGFRQPRRATIVWAVLLVLSINFTLAPALMWVANKVGLSGYEHGLTRLSEFPIWYRVFLAFSAGVIEEIFYRGYAVERLASHRQLLARWLDCGSGVWLGALPRLGARASVGVPF